MGGRGEMYGSSLSTEETTKLLPSAFTNQDSYPRKVEPWPRPLTLALCILGIWQPGVAERAAERASCNQRAGTKHVDRGVPLHSVHSHPPGNRRAADGSGVTGGSFVQTGQGSDDRGDPPAPESWSLSIGCEGTRCFADAQCDICNSCYEEFYNCKSTSRDGKLKKLLYNGVMLLYLVTLTGFMTYDFVVYFTKFWAKVEYLLILVSYCTYLFQVILIPVFVLLTRFMDWFHLLDKDCTWIALHSDFIFQRSQYLRPGSGAASYLSLGLLLAWPTFNGVLRMLYDWLYRPDGNAHTVISRWCAMVSYVMYGSFCYLVYSQRRSLLSEFSVVAHFVAGNAPRGGAAVDVCRDRLSRAYHQYHITRDFVGIWMAFTMAVATWGLTAHLTWNYVLFSYCQTKEVKGLAMLNLLIWSQKIMFFVLPSLAVGGINIDYMWRHFRYTVVQHGRHRYSAFWHDIRKHLSSINLLGQGLSATLVYSALGLYVGLQLSESGQYVDFWNGPGEFNVSVTCNFTRPLH